MHFVDVTKENKERFTVATPGAHVFFLFNYSGRLTIDIKSHNAKVYVFGLYIGKNKDSFNLNTVQHHSVGQNISDLLIKGVFFDNSKFIFEGLIRIDKKAQKSNAYQKNQNLVMSPKVFVDSRPFLEILANDVRCTHGSTTGQLNKEQIYYLESRGLSANKSRKLLVEGFVGDIFDKIQELGFDNNIVDLRREHFNYLNN